MYGDRSGETLLQEALAMKRIALAASTALLALTVLAAPAAAFPDQGQPHSCDVLLDLPKDVIAQIAEHSPETAERLAAAIGDACS
jgi:hypothetical protein